MPSYDVTSLPSLDVTSRRSSRTLPNRSADPIQFSSLLNTDKPLAKPLGMTHKMVGTSFVTEIQEENNGLAIYTYDWICNTLTCKWREEGGWIKSFYQDVVQDADFTLWYDTMIGEPTKQIRLGTVVNGYFEPETDI